MSEGTVTIRDTANQQQNVNELSRDVEHANQALSPIFDKEKEQQRLKEAQLIGEIGSQTMDIARTQGQIAGEKAKSDPQALAAAKEALAGKGKLNPTADEIAKQAYDTAMKPFGTGSALQQGLQAATAAIQGLAGGIVGDSTADAQAGKTSVENNFLSNTDSDRLDKAVEKIKQGDKSLSAANELLKLENADKRSDALVSKFTKDPAQMTSTERAELAGYLRIYASEMEKEYGPAVSQELVKGLLSGQDYVKRNPDSEAMGKAQSIMNTWGYHRSNASIGDAPLILGGSVLGVTVKGMAANAAIGVGVNAGVQLAGKDPFSYVDVIMAGVTAAATTGKGIIVSTPVNVGGAVVGSAIKGEDPTGSAIAAGAGSIFGGVAGKVATEQLKSVIKEGSAEIIGTVTGGTVSEITGKNVQDALNNAGDKDGKN